MGSSDKDDDDGSYLPVRVAAANVRTTTSSINDGRHEAAWFAPRLIFNDAVIVVGDRDVGVVRKCHNPAAGMPFTFFTSSHSRGRAQTHLVADD